VVVYAARNLTLALPGDKIYLGEKFEYGVHSTHTHDAPLRSVKGWVLSLLPHSAAFGLPNCPVFALFSKKRKRKRKKIGRE